jgi:hypothetical protein
VQVLEQMHFQLADQLVLLMMMKKKHLHVWD